MRVRSVERSVRVDGQARNEVPNTAGADHAYVPPLDPEEEEAAKRGFKGIKPSYV